MKDQSENRQNILKFASAEKVPRSYQFAQFRFDARDRQLFRGEVAVPLTPKVAELLLVLLRSRGQLLTKETLMSALWPDSYVEESNLKQNVFVLRKALGNGSESEGFIQTVPRRGYRFVAEVVECEQDNHPPNGRGIGALVRQRHYIAVAVLATVIAGVAFLLSTRIRNQSSEQRPEGISQGAYENYLKGRHHWNRRTSPDFRQAVEYFRTAVEQEPKFALAWAGLADAYNFLGDAPRAKVAAQRALEIDEGLAEAHAAMANVSLFHDFDWAAAERHFKRAIDLNPSYATAHHWYAFLLAANGEFDEALREIERARSLEPLSLIINTDVGQILFYARRYDEAIRKFREVLRLDPDFAQAHAALAEAYLRTGNPEEARTELPASAFTQSFLGELHTVAGEQTRARELAARLENEFHTDRHTDSAYRIARLYAALGLSTKAVEWLDRSFTSRDGNLAMVNVDPAFDPLRNDPRFGDFLQRTGLRSR